MIVCRGNAPAEVQVFVNVGVSHTGGVLDLWTACIPVAKMEVRGWLGRGEMMIDLSLKGMAARWGTCNLDGLTSTGWLPAPCSGWKCRRGATWGVLYGKSGKIMVLFPIPRPGGTEEFEIVPVPVGYYLEWVDFLEEGHDDEAVAFVLRQPEVWHIDLAATYQNTQFVLKSAWPSDRFGDLRHIMLLSRSGEMVVASQYSSVNYMTIERPATVHESKSRVTHKVGWRHFAELEDNNSREIRVFSTSNFTTPCRVFRLNSRARFKFEGGFVALWDLGGNHMDLS
ncbi:hypothetical protein Pelo_16731 [Pelomyxa schiedti]|nr:hypothetical protein Pelo_16731 [Pelomyxa schiedti]